MIDQMSIKMYLYTYRIDQTYRNAALVTTTTATLIDHILTNNLDDNMMHIQGLLCTSISDHYAVFHIASNAKTDHAQTEMPLLKRNMGQTNMSIFFLWN